jgi:hypothetical protein
MVNSARSHVGVRVQRRGKLRVAAVGVAAAIAAGVATHHVNQPADPEPEAMGRVIPTPCDGFADCVYTAYWYYFLR